MLCYCCVNIDGQFLYKIEICIMVVGLFSGIVVIINLFDKFVQVIVLIGCLYIIDVGYYQGLIIIEEIFVGDLVVGNYVEEGCELVLCCLSGVYKKDSLIKLGIVGQFIFVIFDIDLVIGYSQDEYIIVVSIIDFICVCMCVGIVVVVGV